MQFQSKVCATAMALVLAAGAASAEGELKLYHWFDYIPQELLDQFADEYDVTVTMDTFDSNEAMLATLKAGKLGDYDVAFPSDYMVEIMASEGMLDTFDPAELSNFANILPQWIDVSFDRGRNSSIPYQWGSTNFAVNNSAYNRDVNTTAILFDPPEELRGQINVLDSQGELLALASMHLGIPQCTTDREQLQALNDLVQGARDHWASFGSDIAKDSLVSGDALVSMIYSGQASKARAEGADITYAFPAEGYVLFADSAVLLADAPNRDNAILFMNFLLEPENAAAVSNFAQYGSSILGADAFLSEELRNSPELNPPSNATGQFVQACTEDVQIVYDTIWTNLKE